MRGLIFFLLSAVLPLSLYPQQWYTSYTPYYRDVNTIKIFDGNTVLVAGGHLFNDSIEGIFKTGDRGLTWQDVFIDKISSWITSVDFKDSLNGVAVGTNGKIIKTADAGKTWDGLITPLNRDFNKIVFVDAATAFIVGGKQAGPFQTILKSTDGGQTWNTVHDQAGSWLRAVAFADMNTGYAVGDSGTILETTNGGNTWAPVAAPVQGRDFAGICFTGAAHGVIVGGTPANDTVTILRTTNGGANWLPLTDDAGGILNDVYFLNPATGYAVGGNATLLKTIDSGQTWSRQLVQNAVPAEYFTSVRFYQDTFGIIGAKGGYVHIYTKVMAPEAFTLGAVIGDSTRVAMRGAVNSHGYPARYFFVLSNDSTFSAPLTTFEKTILNDSLLLVFDDATMLAPNTKYYYYIQIESFGGTCIGDTLTFYTGIPFTAISTFIAAQVTNSSAILQGSVNGFAGPVNLYFEYGTTPAALNQIAATPAMVADTAYHTVSANLTSLQAKKMYYYRLKGVAGGTDYYGDMQAFFTGTPYDIINTLPLTGITDSTATFNGEVSGLKLHGTLSFDFSMGGMDFTSNIVSGPAMVNDTAYYKVTAFVNNLLPGGVYYIRFKVATALGIYYGDTVLFYSGMPYVSVETATASYVTGNSAQINGRAGHFSVPVDLNFEYGTTQALGNVLQASPSSINDTGTYMVSANLSGLAPNTLYYYKLKATTQSGATASGGIRQLYTGNTIPNWDFQNWHIDTIQFPYPWAIIPDFAERVPGRTGSALQLHGQNIAVNCKFIVGDGGPFFFDGAPLSYRPDSVVGYFNCSIAPGDTALMIVQLTGNGNLISDALYPIVGNTAGAFQRFAYKIDYLSGNTPDSVIMGFVSTSQFGGTTSNTNTLAIDDISFVPATQNIPNADFETWTTYSQLNLDAWFYFKYLNYDYVTAGKPPMVTREYFDLPDDYAIELKNSDVTGHGSLVDCSVRTAMNLFNENAPSFPMNVRHQTLHAFVKYYPLAGDTLSLFIGVFKQGQYSGYGQLDLTDSITTFAPVEVLIDYQDPLIVPDSAVIGIKMTAHGLSRAIIDKLSFDGFAGSVTGVSLIESIALPGLKLYPNPASSFITIEADVKGESCLQIFDVRGGLVFKEKVINGRISIDAGSFTNGLYIVRMGNEKSGMQGKLMVIK